MSTAANFGLHRTSRLRAFASLNRTWVVSILFGAVIAVQGLGFLVLGTGQAGCSLSESIIVLQGLIAIACTWIAFRRAQGVTALFWFLFGVVLVVLAVPTVLQIFGTVFGQPLLPEPTRGLLYALYGAPVLMMLFLPDTHWRTRVKFEIFLDLLQVAIVVGLIYSAFFFVPMRVMLPADAMTHNVSISDAQSLLLLIAAFIRLQFVRAGRNRSLLIRLGLFLMICAVATFIGDWLYLKNDPGIAAWIDLLWSIPQAAAALIAITWAPSPDPASAPAPQQASFFGLLGINLVLVAMLSCVALLMDRWKQATGATLTDVAIGASLLSFTFRLALTQFHQQQEIAQRKAAQRQATASHEEVGRLLDDSRRQTAEITQISELGSLLHACTSKEEVFRLIPERLRRLFPGASGCIALLSASKNHLESVAQWGICTANGIFAPEQCWALRRGTVHVHSGGHSEPRCAHLLGEGPSVCIPLIVNGEAIGTLSIQDNGLMHPGPDPEFDSNALARRRHLAAAVAEHLSLAVANLSLRESLRLQAVRDPLTGLYNRRYMQEFLERELHSARRKRRPLAVLMIDLDHFKRYNDNYGHAAGDKALAAVGEGLLRSVRAEDVACRYGGEEFTVILPECSLSQAAGRAEQIRTRLKEYRSQHDGQPADALTASIGVAAYPETTDRVDLLLKFADEALYQAKRAGRDRVVTARPACAVPTAKAGEKSLTSVI